MKILLVLSIFSIFRLSLHYQKDDKNQNEPTFHIISKFYSEKAILDRISKSFLSRFKRKSRNPVDGGKGGSTDKNGKGRTGRSGSTGISEISFIGDAKAIDQKCSVLYAPCSESANANLDEEKDFFRCSAEYGIDGYCLKTEGTSCANHRSCAIGLMCKDGFCEKDKACKKIGQSCGYHTECCSNLICSEAAKICEPCYECREISESCYIDSHCRGWNLFCDGGYCKQCPDLVHKKNCIKFGYFCRTDDECRPGQSCKYLEYKDEYLCLGMHDFRDVTKVKMSERRMKQKSSNFKEPISIEEEVKLFEDPKYSNLEKKQKDEELNEEINLEGISEFTTPDLLFKSNHFSNSKKKNGNSTNIENQNKRKIFTILKSQKISKIPFNSSNVNIDLKNLQK